MKYTPTRTSYNARYTFSAKEKDTETGYSYFGARYYSSDLSIWLSVDPLADKYPSMSAYTYCADNPVKLVDPNGEEIGNYYDISGHFIGSDGKDDGKTYVVTDGDGINVDNNTVTVNNKQSVTLLPTLEERESLLTSLESFDADCPNSEWGGIYGNEYSQKNQSFAQDGSFRWGTPGEENPCGETLSYNPESADLSNIRILIAFHTHGSGYCKEKNKGWEQEPSPQDQKNAAQWNVRTGGSARTLVFGMGNKTVYFYNKNTNHGGMSFDNFRTIK